MLNSRFLFSSVSTSRTFFVASSFVSVFEKFLLLWSASENAETILSSPSRSFAGKGRTQRAQLHFARQFVTVIPRHRSVDRTAVAPDRAANGTHAGASGTLLLPQLFAGAGYFMAGLDLVGAGASPRQIMAHRLVEQVVIDFRPEDGVGEFHFADLLIL